MPNKPLNLIAKCLLKIENIKNSQSNNMHLFDQPMPLLNDLILVNRTLDIYN